jgi:hypothetical protein
MEDKGLFLALQIAVIRTSLFTSNLVASLFQEMNSSKEMEFIASCDEFCRRKRALHLHFCASFEVLA